MDARSAEKFDPAPLPRLNTRPSTVASSRMEGRWSSTPRMKHAAHCGWGSKPTLNQTGELNDARCCSSNAASSSSNAAASPAPASTPPARTQPAIVPTTRPTSPRTLRSRAFVPRRPAK